MKIRKNSPIAKTLAGIGKNWTAEQRAKFVSEVKNCKTVSELQKMLKSYRN